MSFSVEGLLEVLDRALKYILSSLQVQLLLMRFAIHLLLSTVHHFRIGKGPGLARLFGFVQVFRLRDEGRNDSPSYYLYVLEHIARIVCGFGRSGLTTCIWDETGAPQDSQFQVLDIHQKVMKSIEDQQLIDPSKRRRHATGEIAQLAQRLQFHLADAFTRNIEQTTNLSQGVALIAV